MTEQMRQELLAEYEREVVAARRRLNAAREGTRAWRKAGDDLNFWQGKVAFVYHARI